MGDPHYLTRNSLLQDGVSAAMATLHAIEAADLFRALPEDASAQVEHNDGCALLAMLGDHLASIQRKVGAFDAAPAAKAEG